MAANRPMPPRLVGIRPALATVILRVVKSRSPLRPKASSTPYATSTNQDHLRAGDECSFRHKKPHKCDVAKINDEWKEL